MDRDISSLDGFLRRRLGSLSTTDAALDPKKLQWFREINARAVTRVFEKLERHGQAENPSYCSLQARWLALQSAWETQFASTAAAARSGLILAEDAVWVSSDRTAVGAILSADSQGITPLHLAVIGGHTQAASSMIDSLRAAGGALAGMNVMGDVLTIALRSQNDDMVHCVLRRGCVDFRRRSQCRGEIALHVAVQLGRLDYAALIVEAMRKQGASLDVPDNSRGWTPLFFACADGDAGIVRLLIEAGSSQRQQDHLGWTAKEVAAFRGHLAIAALFEGSDICSRTTGGPANTLPHNRKASAGTVRCGDDQKIIIASLGTTRGDQAVTALDLSFCSSAHAPGKFKAASFVLEVSVTGVSERRRVPLPILDDQINDPFVFIVPNTAEPCLVFDVIRLTDVLGKEVLAASGTALLGSNRRQFGTCRQSLVREHTVPMLDKDTMRMAGVLTFTPLVVSPFPHLQIPRPNIGLIRAPSAPPLLVGHRGAGQNDGGRDHLQIGENTVGSFLSAIKLGASFVEFDIQITRDLQAVAFHDFSLSESGTDVPIHDVTLDQFLYASNAQSPHGNPLSVLGTAHAREESGRSRSRSLGRQFEAGAIQVQDRIRHTVDFKLKGFKPNTRGDFIQDSFATFKEILVGLPQDIGCDIEISASPSSCCRQGRAEGVGNLR